MRKFKLGVDASEKTASIVSGGASIDLASVTPRIKSFRAVGEVGGPRQIKHYSLPFADGGPELAISKGGPTRLFWELFMISNYDSLKANGLLP